MNPINFDNSSFGEKKLIDKFIGHFSRRQASLEKQSADPLQK
jgi:hypothetical protein